MDKSKSVSLPKEAVHLPNSAWDQIVSQLDEQGARVFAESPPNRRIHERKRYTKIVRCIVRIKQNGSPAAVFQVHTRNLSVGGLGFFFGAYLHPGTQCHLAIINLHGQGSVLSATMRWCRHVSKTLHECGVQFDEMIDVEQFLNPDTTPVD